MKRVQSLICRHNTGDHEVLQPFPSSKEVVAIAYGMENSSTNEADRRKRQNEERFTRFFQFVSPDGKGVRYSTWKLPPYIAPMDILQDALISVLKTIENQQYWIGEDLTIVPEKDRWWLGQGEHDQGPTLYFYVGRAYRNKMIKLHGREKPIITVSIHRGDGTTISLPEEMDDEDWVVLEHLKRNIQRLYELREQIIEVFKDPTSDAYLRCVFPKSQRALIAGTVIDVLENFGNLAEFVGDQKLALGDYITDRLRKRDSNGYLTDPQVPEDTRKKRRSQARKYFYETLLRAISYFEK